MTTTAAAAATDDDDYSNYSDDKLCSTWLQ